MKAIIQIRQEEVTERLRHAILHYINAFANGEHLELENPSYSSDDIVGAIESEVTNPSSTSSVYSVRIDIDRVLHCLYYRDCRYVFMLNYATPEIYIGYSTILSDLQVLMSAISLKSAAWRYVNN